MPVPLSSAQAAVAANGGNVPARHLMEHAPFGVIVASPDDGGSIVYLNTRVVGMFSDRNGPEAASMTESTRDLFDRNGESLDFRRSPLGIALYDRIPAHSEVQYRPAAGQPLWFDIMALPLEEPQWTDEHGPLAVAYLHDMTHRRQVEADLDEANRTLGVQLEDMTRLRALTDRLASGASVDETLFEVLRSGAHLLDAQMGIARVLDDEQTMANRAFFGVTEEEIRLIEDVSQKDYATDAQLRTTHSLVIEDVRLDPVAGPYLRELGEAVGFRSVYAIALNDRDGNRVGTCVWARSVPGRPTGRQRGLAETYCRFAEQIIENQRLYEREHTIATTLQQSMLPQHLPHVPGLEITAHSVPGARGMEAGGDWYDVLALGRGRAGLAIGDVMGKGLPAATAMGQLRTALHSYALIDGENPAAVLGDLNALIGDMELSDLATAAYLVLDPLRHQLHLASAGHCPPLLLDHNGARYLESGQGPPLGVQDAWHADNGTIRLEPGSLLILYTDGLVERRGEDLDTGLERLRQCALTAPGDLGELCAHLLDGCVGNAVETEDDVAILAVRVS
ncbi:MULTISPECIES: GAF domain-containing SpoIIE family protein phosphatase [Streptacidiphilus]|uniref:SpoIIE family protein phosphatase n=1 Tax=Streptacidiphilus cavernicola TaxID=3342716 RepID=A0ABV6UP61_9ACTN|nr:GAF domain-containing SpoIIE family protein phosphatase [Streptacidiphilus jeojiense]